MKIFKILRLVIPIVILGSLGYWYYTAQLSDDTNIYYGEIELDSYDVYATVPGVIETVSVEEGALVEVGATLMTLEMDKALLQQKKAQISTGISEEYVVKSQAPADEEALNIQRNTINQLESQRQSASASVQSVRQLYEQSRIASESLKAALDLQIQSYENAKALYEGGVTTKVSLDQAALELTQSQNSYDSALAQNSKILSDIQSLEGQKGAISSQILSAKEGLKALEGGYGESDRIITDLSDDVAQLDVALAQKNLDDHYIQAKQSGRVESVNYTVGEFVAAGVPVVSLFDPSKPRVTLYVHEKDLFRLDQGMVLDFYLTAVPEKQISGKVIHIASEAMFTPVNIVVEEDRERLVYEVEVELTTEETLKAGMLLATDFGELGTR